MIDHTSSTPVGSGKIVAGVTSCVTDGAEEVTCDVCHRVFTRTIPAHKYVKESEVAATCTAEGSITYKCSVCGATKVEATEMIDHDYTTPVTVTEATCKVDGLTLSVCKVCGDEKKEITKKLEHTGNPVKGWAKTLDENGNYVLTKEEGGKEVFDSDKIDTEKTAADCEHDLIEAYECTACHEIQVKVLAKKLGHRIDSSVAVKTGAVLADAKGNPVKDANTNKYVVAEGGKADCTHVEAKVFKCANCQQEQAVVITEKADHTPLAGSEVVYGATCTADGYRTYTCTGCNEKITEETGEKALGHNYVYVAETCTTPATIKCTRCPDEIDKDEITELKSKVDSGTDAEKDLIDQLTKILKDAGVLTADQSITNFTDYNPAKGHKIVANRGTEGYCANEGKWIEGAAIAVDEDETVPADTNTFESNGGGTVDAELKDRMNNVTVDIKDNIVTIKQKENNFSHEDDSRKNSIGIMLDVGIKAENLIITSGNYAFEKGDTDLTQMKAWNPNATENSFMIWLTPSDIGEGFSITFKDKTGYITLPVTVTFYYEAAK